jgi:hypothetical protein
MRRDGAGGTGTGPDLAEIRRSEHAETGAWDEVEAAVLARSAGRSRAEMRQMLIAELQSLNRPVPDDRILDLRVEQVTFAPQPLPSDASAFTVLKALAGMVRQGRAVHKKLTAMRGEVHRLEGPRGQPPYLVGAVYSLPMADVILGPGAAAILDSFGGGIVVSLERVPAGRDPVPVAVYSGWSRDAQRGGWGVEPACPGCRAAGGRVLDGSRHPE